MLRIFVLTLLMLACMGCNLLPDVAHQPVVHNPFPQLGRVAVAPFFNLSDEKTVDGEQFANAYFTELQSVPGFEVIPPNVVTQAIIEHQLLLGNPDDVRRLAQILGVDAVVVGAVTEYSPYYPPRVGLKVDWFAANPGFHAIPPGYGLPWGTVEEEFIPSPLVFEAEFALAQAQLETQTPRDKPEPEELPLPEIEPPMPRPGSNDISGDGGTPKDITATAAEEEILEEIPLGYPEMGYLDPTGVADGMTMPRDPNLPENWPDERAFIPPPPSPNPPISKPYGGPVITHTQIYSGNDSSVTEALASYVYFRDDARQGGWQSYLKRSDDYIRFCCRMHIFETLSARGGGGETRVVWRWLESR